MGKIKCALMRLRFWLKWKRCHCCGKHLGLLDITAVGPEVWLWCKYCKPFSSVYQQIWLEEKMGQLEKKYGV